MELADLTKGMRKIKFLEPDFFFAKPGLSEFHKSSAEKINFSGREQIVFFSQCLA